MSKPKERVVVDARRKCLVCDWEQTAVELESADVIGAPCARCNAPTERIATTGRRVEPVGRNPHAAALGRLGGLRGGPARAAALTARQRRDIARAAALARWHR